MRLESLRIIDLYGGINLNINFNSDITLLVGINGCGKTSALNAIDWLLKPNLKQLAITEYKELSLSFTYKNNQYTLKSAQTQKLVTLSITSDVISLEPITINLVHKKIPTDEQLALNFYSQLAPEKHEIPMWDFLKSLTKPTVITLDRTITAEAEEVRYFEQMQLPRNTTNRNRSPLAHVKEVTAAKYSEYRKKATRNDEELKAKIVMSALQSPESVFNERPVKPMTAGEIKNLENKVIKYLSTTIKTDEVINQVKTFFTTLKTIPSRKKLDGYDSSLLMDFVRYQYRQLENLAKAFNSYEVKNSAAFKEIQEYLDAVNSFFNDSSKELHFDDSTGKLVFSFLESNNHQLEKKTVDLLSSGEKQILILFTFLAFVAQKGGIFIVDEPELSLHPKWQHELMESFLKVCPPNTQLLLATHSPDIVGRFKNSCVPLKRK